MANNPRAADNLKPFSKGDRRINRKGRPKTFDALRKEAVKLACEFITNPATGEQISVARLILEGWAKSGDLQAQRAFVEYAYGKVPTPQEVSGPGGEAQKMIIEIVRRDLSDSDDNDDGATDIAAPAFEATADQTTGGEV